MQCLEAVYSSDRVSEEVVMSVEETLKTAPEVQKMFLQVRRSVKRVNTLLAVRTLGKLHGCIVGVSDRPWRKHDTCHFRRLYDVYLAKTRCFVLLRWCNVVWLYPAYSLRGVACCA